ncbi:MAG TPA: MarR family winged helix-turn-helix transcriptional regulator [Bryobacteraceae bacterium]
MRPEEGLEGNRRGRAESLPLSALLSQALVAFTIECDNEFEHRMPHRTSNYGSTGKGPWLVSIVMWWNCMRFVGDAGVRVAELEELARTKTNLNGMERWGYIAVEAKGPSRDSIVRATAMGRQAREVWEPLPAAIEERWRKRFGTDEVTELRKPLAEIVDQIPFDLPDCLPILGNGLFSRERVPVRPVSRGSKQTASNLALPVLLSQVLLEFAIEFEKDSDLSLAITADVVRVLHEAGVRVRDLPLLGGVSKEAVSMAMGVLEKLRLAVVEAGPAGRRAKLARLTASGREIQDRYPRLVGAIEKRWDERFGQNTMAALRDALERLEVEPGATSPLLRGLEPYADCWRASVQRPARLPHYPMVLHRGGFPDGS